MEHRVLKLIAAVALLCAVGSSAFAADMVVIVNKDNTKDISKSTIEKIYKGEMASWPGGGPVVVYDQSESSDIRANFTKSLLGMSVSASKAAWMVKLFSGKATPPKMVSSDAEMKSAVAANKNAIGYISASNLDGSVKSVLSLP